jgi:hypothetical protein
MISRIDVRSVSHLSVLSDARGVIYMARGELFVVLDGEDVFRPPSAPGTGD